MLIVCHFSSFLEINKVSLEEAINSEIDPNVIQGYKTQKTGEKLKILIAGCGTGQQLILAQRYKNAKIIAIDISSKSLAYAQRKLDEYQIKNVKLIQMDILDIEILNEKFDIIECVGVLHHMEHPLDGFR